MASSAAAANHHNGSNWLYDANGASFALTLSRAHFLTQQLARFALSSFCPTLGATISGPPNSMLITGTSTLGSFIKFAY